MFTKCANMHELKLKCIVSARSICLIVVIKNLNFPRKNSLDLFGTMYMYHYESCKFFNDASSIAANDRLRTNVYSVMHWCNFDSNLNAFD